MRRPRRLDGLRRLLFLLDELFHGTNSHDRLLGAEGVLRSLLDCGAIGLITTHDLALTAIADELAPRALNVHFEDWFEGNDIKFDFKMKPGPVTGSNALALMRAAGLKVASSTQGLDFAKSPIRHGPDAFQQVAEKGGNLGCVFPQPLRAATPVRGLYGTPNAIPIALQHKVPCVRCLRGLSCFVPYCGLGSARR